MVVELFGRKIIWSRVLGRGSFSHISFGRRVIWSRGHLDARSFSRMVIRSHGNLVAWLFGRRSFGRESFFCKKGHLQQNSVVFASNWRSRNLAFVFIEEVGEWNPLVFAFNSGKHETSFLIYRKKWRTEFTSFCIQIGDQGT
jgi:hypothetical protein